MALFENAMAELTEALQAEVAVNIIYHRGVEVLELNGKAWIGTTAFRITDSPMSGEGKASSRLVFSDRDFMIPVKDLVFGGEQVLPDPDQDWIEQVFDITDVTHPQPILRFEMMAPDREPKWRYLDPQKTIYRIHTKQVEYTNV